MKLFLRGYVLGNLMLCFPRINLSIKLVHTYQYMNTKNKASSVETALNIVVTYINDDRLKNSNNQTIGARWPSCWSLECVQIFIQIWIRLLVHFILTISLTLVWMITEENFVNGIIHSFKQVVLVRTSLISRIGLIPLDVLLKIW